MHVSNIRAGRNAVTGETRGFSTRNLINSVFYTLHTNYGEFFVPEYNA